jgi:hypothetical protein
MIFRSPVPYGYQNPYQQNPYGGGYTYSNSNYSAYNVNAGKSLYSNTVYVGVYIFKRSISDEPSY